MYLKCKKLKSEQNLYIIELVKFSFKIKSSTFALQLNKANLLFLDNPVGTGFSYVTNTSALARDNKQIAKDLVVTLSSVLDTVPEFQVSHYLQFSVL